MELYFAIPLGLLLIASFVWAIAKNFLTTPVQPLQNVEEAHVVVTGGSKGIGKAVAKRAAIEGCHVSILARSPAPLEAAAEELRSVADANALERGKGQEVRSLSADVSDASAVRAALTELEAQRPIDVLVCNVGGSVQAPFEEIGEEDFERQMRLNYLSAVHSIRAVLPAMKKRRSGRILLMSSQAGQLGVFGYTAYSPAKFALRGLAEALQMELTPFNIRITLAFPPNTATEGFARELEEMPPETAEISGTSGTWEPDKVAALIWDDVVEGNHYSSIGLDGWLLARGTAGMSPETEPLRVIQQFFLSGPLRLISLGYLRYFDHIVHKHYRRRLKNQ